MIYIASVHVKGRNSKLLIKLQSKFINSYSINSDYNIIVNNDLPKAYERHANIIHVSKEKLSHLQCINIAFEKFLQSSCSHFLLLDSDCWPVHNKWETHSLNYLSGYSYLAPARYENFDNFPHPCAMLIKRSFVEKVNFGFARINNILGENVSDVCAAMPQYINKKQTWFPLVKTNHISFHPIFASIYGDLFYHHCAGSRGLGFRSAKHPLYRNIFSAQYHQNVHKITLTMLKSDPFRYINELRGLIPQQLTKSIVRY